LPVCLTPDALLQLAAESGTCHPLAAIGAISPAAGLYPSCDGISHGTGAGSYLLWQANALLGSCDWLKST